MHKVQLNPVGWMSQLSQSEMKSVTASHHPERYQLFRRCCLAVLNSGAETDDMHKLMSDNENFQIHLIRKERGVKIELENPPSQAFVDGKLIKGVHEHLFSVMRDLLYMEDKYPQGVCQLTTPEKSNSGTQLATGQCTDLVFDMLRHANAISTNEDLNTIVCWGGHSIRPHEYQYTKEVGYQLGLREFNICTGCGPGAMKGPMKGAAIGHAKQRVSNGRYIGITEPSIIAAEPPNAIVNELIIMPDIEKRLEAFVRFAHGIIVFPGGAGTAEELLYILGVLLQAENHQQKIPLVLTGPQESESYFIELDSFIKATLGFKATQLYTIIIDDPKAVGQFFAKQHQDVKQARRNIGDSYGYNWSLQIPSAMQHPFVPSHENMAGLDLHLEQPIGDLAATLRCAFSGIVAGNIKAEAVQDIAQKGPYQLNGEPKLMNLLDKLLQAFVAQGRMKLPGTQYEPCYIIAQTHNE